MSSHTEGTPPKDQVLHECSVDEFAMGEFSGNRKYRIQDGRVYYTMREEKPQSQIKFLYALKKYIQNSPNISEATLRKLKTRTNEILEHQQEIKPCSKMSIARKIRSFFIQKIALPMAERLSIKINQNLDKKIHRTFDFEALDFLVTSADEGTLGNDESATLKELLKDDSERARFLSIGIFRDYVRDIPVLDEAGFLGAFQTINDEVRFLNAKIKPPNVEAKRAESIDFIRSIIKYFETNEKLLKDSINKLQNELSDLEKTGKKPGKEFDRLEQKCSDYQKMLNLHNGLYDEMLIELKKLSTIYRFPTREMEGKSS